MEEKNEAVPAANMSVEKLNALNKGNMGETLGIQFTEASPDLLVATMPVTDAVRQPFGLLHGGASVAFAETLASVAALMAVPEGIEAHVVGLEINANHLKAVRSGFVTGKCRPLQKGRHFSVWEVKIENESGQLVCICRMTAAIIEKKNQASNQKS